VQIECHAQGNPAVNLRSKIIRKKKISSEQSRQEFAVAGKINEGLFQRVVNGNQLATAEGQPKDD
jgi:hypothetical protein